MENRTLNKKLFNFKINVILMNKILINFVSLKYCVHLNAGDQHIVLRRFHTIRLDHYPTWGEINLWLSLLASPAI